MSKKDSNPQETITKTMSSKHPPMIRTHNMELMAMLVYQTKNEEPQMFSLIHSNYTFDTLKGIFEHTDSGKQYGVTIRELKRKRTKENK